MASDLISDVNEDAFEAEVLRSEVPVLVDFWATWCGPCKAIAPLLEQVAGDYEGKLRICKVDIDHNPGIPQKYGVRAVPTLLLFKGGEPIDQRVGALNHKALQEFVDQAM